MADARLLRDGELALHQALEGLGEGDLPHVALAFGRGVPVGGVAVLLAAVGRHIFDADRGRGRGDIHRRADEHGAIDRKDGLGVVDRCVVNGDGLRGDHGAARVRGLNDQLAREGGAAFLFGDRHAREHARAADRVDVHQSVRIREIQGFHVQVGVGVGRQNGQSRQRHGAKHQNERQRKRKPSFFHNRSPLLLKKATFRHSLFSLY